MAHKKLKDLNLKDAFLFAATLEEEDTCKKILQTVCGEQIEKVCVHAEHTVLYSPESRGIRLDIYVKEETGKIYDVEMQQMGRKNLPQRSRYYQADMDVMNLHPGEDFESMSPSYVVFICCFDPFGKGLYRYTFENRCLERDISLGDGTRKIFLNTKGSNDNEVEPELIHFLHYVEDSTSECADRMQDAFIDQLHERVEALKQNRGLEKRYMTLEEYLEDRLKEELEEELPKRIEEELSKRLEEELPKRMETQQKKLLALTTCMVEDGRAEQIFRLQQDKDFLQEMLAKYQL